jgi:hypothetical protein
MKLSNLSRETHRFAKMHDLEQKKILLAAAVRPAEEAQLA